jgi:hypothetical protein
MHPPGLRLLASLIVVAVLGAGAHTAYELGTSDVTFNRDFATYTSSDARVYLSNATDAAGKLGIDSSGVYQVASPTSLEGTPRLTAFYPPQVDLFSPSGAYLQQQVPTFHVAVAGGNIIYYNRI